MSACAANDKNNGAARAKRGSSEFRVGLCLVRPIIVATAPSDRQGATVQDVVTYVLILAIFILPLAVLFLLGGVLLKIVFLLQSLIVSTPFG